MQITKCRAFLYEEGEFIEFIKDQYCVSAHNIYDVIPVKGGSIAQVKRSEKNDSLVAHFLCKKGLVPDKTKVPVEIREDENTISLASARGESPYSVYRQEGDDIEGFTFDSSNFTIFDENLLALLEE